MDRETCLNKIKEIGLCENIETARTKLDELKEDISKVYDSADESTQNIESLNQEIEKYKEDMEDLRKANMGLFKRLGAEKTPEEQKKASTGISDPEEHRRKFEDLFNEKGMIK